ncbi:MAG: cytochrome c-type biogenesis CcmF C-terminal domain-containing protein, partial [Burkholderiaceae bacterium]|nr:cytochrome c-type biogenesis CcmF C-terminal domain-containing protein [Burkholderiaceae bacterium]
AAIDSNALRHVYVALGEPLNDGAWSVRVYYKPFVNWIWVGCVLMALGGLLAVSDRRYRLKLRERRSALAGAQLAP